MRRATYICQIGCVSDCPHGLLCMVWRSDAEHPHPTRHIAHDPTADQMHEWSDAKRPTCKITPADRS